MLTVQGLCKEAQEFCNISGHRDVVFSKKMVIIFPPSVLEVENLPPSELSLWMS